jgi:hypothetical protein
MKKQKLNYPDVIQPKDKSHILYSLLDQYLVLGDEKSIAISLQVRENSVSGVKIGRDRSARIWDALVSIMMKRKEEEDRIIKYLTSNKAA